MKILDTTIRDGSYAVDFRFTCKDVEHICSRLEKLNIEYIEIGHGQGLNASSQEHGYALHSDEEYLKAAKSVVGQSKIGFFCIPGIARLEDLDMARQGGCDFVRIGVNANMPEQAGGFIKHAKNLGLIIMVNYMKTYIVSPEEFAKNALWAHEQGAECVYIVDSAGSMLPDELRRYYEETRKLTNVKLGFHGHNNLGLAVSNSIYCADLGFDMIDTSMQGLGRSLGNASTEMTIMALKKKGYDLDVDIPRLLEYGYVSLRDITDGKVQNPLDLICGYAGFHSSYIKDIYKCCNEKNVDPLRLILAYSEVDQRDMDYKKLCDIAEKLPEDLEDNPYTFREYFSSRYID